MPPWMQYVVFAAACLYIWERVSKWLNEWEAERRELNRFNAELRAEEQDRKLVAWRADCAFEKYNDHLTACDATHASYREAYR